MNDDATPGHAQLRISLVTGRVALDTESGHTTSMNRSIATASSSWHCHFFLKKPKFKPLQILSRSWWLKPTP